MAVTAFHLRNRPVDSMEEGLLVDSIKELPFLGWFKVTQIKKICNILINTLDEKNPIFIKIISN